MIVEGNKALHEYGDMSSRNINLELNQINIFFASTHIVVPHVLIYTLNWTFLDLEGVFWNSASCTKMAILAEITCHTVSKFVLGRDHWLIQKYMQEFLKFWFLIILWRTKFLGLPNFVKIRNLNQLFTLIGIKWKNAKFQNLLPMNLTNSLCNKFSLCNL